MHESLPTGPDPETISRYITTTVPDIDVVSIEGMRFFSLDPDKPETRTGSGPGSQSTGSQPIGWWVGDTEDGRTVGAADETGGSGDMIAGSPHAATTPATIGTAAISRMRLTSPLHRVQVERSTTDRSQSSALLLA